MTKRRHGILAVVCAFGLLAGACGDDDDVTSSASTTAATSDADQADAIPQDDGTTSNDDLEGAPSGGDDALDDDQLALCLAYLDFWSAVAAEDDDLSVEASALLDVFETPGPGGVIQQLENARDGEPFQMADIVGYIDPTCPSEYQAQSDFGGESEGN